MKGMRGISPIGVRIPEELKDKIQDLAKNSGRSMNSEIVHLLEKSLLENDGCESSEKKEHEMLSDFNDTVRQLVSLMKVQEKAIEAYREQVALMKALVLKETGYDIEEFLRQNVDYEGLGLKPSSSYVSKPK